MAITFAVQGTAKKARKALGNATPAEYGTNSIDVADISSIINLDQAAFGVHALVYNGMNNLPTGQQFSVLMRCAVGSTTDSDQMFSMAAPANRNGFQSRFSGAGTIVSSVLDIDGNTNVNQTNTFAYSTATYYDFVWLLDTSITTAGLLLYRDGSLVQTTNLNATRAAYTSQAGTFIVLGSQNAAAQNSTRLKVSEFVVWDTIINPTSVALTSGTGSLNGSSRTAYVDVPVIENWHGVDGMLINPGMDGL